MNPHVLYLHLDVSDIVKWDFTRKITCGFFRGWINFKHTSSDPCIWAQWYLSGFVRPSSYHDGKTSLWDSLLFLGSKSSEAEGTYLCFLIVYTRQQDLSFSQEGVGVGHTQTAHSPVKVHVVGGAHGEWLRKYCQRHIAFCTCPFMTSGFLRAKTEISLNGQPPLKLSLKKMIYWVTDWGPAWKDFHLWTLCC